MRYVIIVAPACNVALDGKNPLPNQLILRRAMKLAKKWVRKGRHVVIFTDNYMVRPETLPEGVYWHATDFVKSQVAFLDRLVEFLWGYPDDVKLIGVVTPHYVWGFKDDFKELVKRPVEIDPALLQVPTRYFFSPEGGDKRSRCWAWGMARRKAIHTLQLICRPLYLRISR